MARLSSRSSKDASLPAAAPPHRALVKFLGRSRTYTSKRPEFSTRSAAYTSNTSAAAHPPSPFSLLETMSFRRRIRPHEPHNDEKCSHFPIPPLSEDRKRPEDARKRARPIVDQACPLDCTEISDLLDTGRSVLKRRHDSVGSEEEGDSGEAQRTSGQNWWLACALALDHVVSTDGTIFCQLPSEKTKAAAHRGFSGFLALLQKPEAVCIPEVVNPTQAAFSGLRHLQRNRNCKS